MRTVKPIPFGGGDVPPKLTGRDTRLDFRFDQQRPAVVCKHARIGQTGPLALVARQSLARHLLLRDAQLAQGWNALASSPPEKRPQERSVPIEGADERVGEPILGLRVLVEDVSHASPLWTKGGTNANSTPD